MTPDTVIEFWFGTHHDGYKVSDAVSKKWWSGGPKLDQQCRDRFGDTHHAAACGELAGWCESPHGRLATILLLDQLSRNIHRKTAAAFAADSEAQRICLEGVEAGHDKQLRPIERAFYYMPLMHSEDLAMHDRAAALFAALAEDVPEAERGMYSSFVKHGEQHRSLIERFGRYPHRNEVLGRQSTPEEITYLEADGARFGQ